MNEYGRKVIHIIFGVLITALIVFVPKQEALMILGGGLLGGMIFIDLSIRGYYIPLIGELLVAFERENAFPGKGALFFVTAALIVLILFPSSIAATGVFVLSVLDGFATIAGIRFGRTKVINNKSVEGSVIAILLTFFLLLPFYPVVLSGIMVLAAGIVEHICPFDDNLIIPVIIGLILTFI